VGGEQVNLYRTVKLNGLLEASLAVRTIMSWPEVMSSGSWMLIWLAPWTNPGAMPA